MDLRRSMSLDYLTWDDTETVVYESAVASGNGPTFAVPIARGLEMTSRELAASGGAYAGGGKTWLIPEVFAKYTPKPGDIVHAYSETQWNVLSTEFCRDDAVWQLTTLNPAIAFDLQHQITIERATISYDAAGVAVKAFPTINGGTGVGGGGFNLYTKLPCKVQLVEEEIKDERGIRGSEYKYNIFVGQQIAVNVAEDRVLWQGKYLDIVSLTAPDRIDELPLLQVVLKP